MNDADNIYKKAMILIKSGDWSGAHDIIELINTPLASRIHAYLHRIEGDNWNADYWYQKAGTSRPTCTIDEEWDDIHALIMH